jgi:hypothetical protein
MEPLSLGAQYTTFACSTSKDRFYIFMLFILPTDTDEEPKKLAVLKNKYFALQKLHIQR